MGQTMHDAVKAALIEKAVKECDWEIYDPVQGFTPEKYRRMWKKITGKEITIEEAKQAIESEVDK